MLIGCPDGRAWGAGNEQAQYTRTHKNQIYLRRIAPEDMRNNMGWGQECIETGQTCSKSYSPAES